MNELSYAKSFYMFNSQTNSRAY